jgi:hypothetical protein
MSNKMNVDNLKALVSELAKDVKTPEDLGTLCSFLFTLILALSMQVRPLSVALGTYDR